MKRSILIRSKTLHGPLAKGAAGICLRAMIPCTFHRNSSTTAMDENENLCKHKADIVGRFGRYNVEYEESIKHPERYWLRAASELEWFKQPTLERTLEIHPKHPNMHTWFNDGIINMTYNCLDRHISTRGEQASLIYDSPLTNTKKTYSYNELLDEVSRFSASLLELGVTTGDRIIIYMPMIPEAVVAMLACARIGGIHSVVFGGFAAKELATRIDDCRPKIVISANGGVLPGGKVVEYKPLLDQSMEMAALHSLHVGYNRHAKGCCS